MPAAMQCSRSSLMTFAVSAMMGSRLPRPSSRSRSRMRAVAVKPSITGIWQSINTASMLALGEALQGLGAVVGEDHVRGELLQQPLRHALIHRVVLDQENAAALERWRFAAELRRIRWSASPWPASTLSISFARL